MTIRLILGLVLACAASARPPLVPLLWTQGQPEETIRRAVREVAESGNTGFVWESRPHPDYLGPRWWKDLGAALDEAEKLGLEVWIFDEWMYPSGVAGGKVVQSNPRFSLHTVEERSLAIRGPSELRDWDIPAPLESGQSVVSVVAFRSGADPVDLTPKDGAARVRWSAPPGNWRLLWSVVRVHPVRPGWAMANMIDVMNPAATAEFIRLTHEPTYRHLGRYFGKTLKGFFSDETGFRNVLSYESLPGKPGIPMPWSPILVEYFRKTKGYDLTPWLPALWYNLGEGGRRARYDFVDVCSRAFAENFFRPQQEWCRKHGVRFIGHLVEDNHADHNLGYGPGHWFRAMRYFDMPGIDVVGYQVSPGVDAGSAPWSPTGSLLWDQEHFHFGLPAMARGAALIQGTREIFSEAFGAYGWSQGMRMLKWVGDWHIANGIAVISPHAFTMKHNDPDCPAHFNRMSGNPQWRFYGEWAGPFAREQNIIMESDPLYDAAVLYTAESAWVGTAQKAAPVVRTLETSQVSTVVLPYEALDIAARERIPTVVLPYARYIPGEAARKLAELAESGVRVVVLEAWPEGSVDARADAEVRAAVARLKASPNAVLAATPELPAHVRARRVRFSPAPRSLVAALRRGPGFEWLILHNRSLESAAGGRVAIETAYARAARFDPAGGGFVAVPHRRDLGRLVVDVEIPPYALWCIRLANQAPAAPAPPRFTAGETLRTEWEVSRATDDAAEKFEPLGRRAELSDWRRWPGMESYSGTVRYHATLKLGAAAGPLGLDAGIVEEVAEVQVNGKRLGARIHPPYVWDISAAVRPGENQVVIDVTNTAFARWKDKFSRGDAASGLFGPVKIVRGAILRPAKN